MQDYTKQPCPHCNTFKNRGTSVDAVVEDKGKILLIKRKNDPYAGYWALPGGFVDYDETAQQAVIRELAEETTLTGSNPQFIGYYTDPHRSPNQAFNIAYALTTTGTPQAADDAAELGYFSINDLPPLAFDHHQIISDYLQKQAKQTQYPIVFAALSKRNFYLREHVNKYIIEHGGTPLSAFMMFSYFMLDTVDRDRLIAANNDLIKRCDQLWVFGEISDGVQAEIELAGHMGIPIKYHDPLPSGAITEITPDQATRVYLPYQDKS